MTVLVAKGEGARGFFKKEAGGHRWQRIPPTERRGRVHTSTVTVAVMEAPKTADIELKGLDIEMGFLRAGGPGGQHQNKTSSACRIKHKETGIMVVCRNERNQFRNKAEALRLLKAKLNALEEGRNANRQASKRRDQIGTGLRGDKIRTYRVRDNRVLDHLTGKKTALSRLINGDWSGLK